MQKRIGLFGGSFNPVHFGHLSLVIEIKEKKDLTEVWVFPSNLNPFRTKENGLVSKEHRFRMAELGFSEIPGFKVLDWELKRPSPSYTFDTVEEALKSSPKDSFFLIFGEDLLARFSEWHRVEELIQKIPILIGSRGFSELFLSKLSPEIQKKVREGLVKTSQMEISGTEIRERLKKKLYCGHLVPAKVLDYICENQLYFNA